VPKKCSEKELEAVLIAIFDATDGLLNGHVPIEAITKRPSATWMPRPTQPGASVS